MMPPFPWFVLFAAVTSGWGRKSGETVTSRARDVEPMPRDGARSTSDEGEWWWPLSLTVDNPSMNERLNHAVTNPRTEIELPSPPGCRVELI